MQLTKFTAASMTQSSVASGGEAGQPLVELFGEIGKQRLFRMGFKVLVHGALALRRGQVFAKPNRGDIAPQLLAQVSLGDQWSAQSRLLGVVSATGKQANSRSWWLHPIKFLSTTHRLVTNESQ